jgi:hypothetical protein
MTKIESKCGKYAVVLHNWNSDGTITAVAVSSNVGRGYGDMEYWFTIGSYKTLKNAIRQAAKKMEQMGRPLAI